MIVGVPRESFSEFSRALSRQPFRINQGRFGSGWRRGRGAAGFRPGLRRKGREIVADRAEVFLAADIVAQISAMAPTQNW